MSPAPQRSEPPESHATSGSSTPNQAQTNPQENGNDQSLRARITSDSTSPKNNIEAVERASDLRVDEPQERESSSAVQIPQATSSQTRDTAGATIVGSPEHMMMRRSVSNDPRPGQQFQDWLVSVNVKATYDLTSTVPIEQYWLKTQAVEYTRSLSCSRGTNEFWMDLETWVILWGLQRSVIKVHSCLVSCDCAYSWQEEEIMLTPYAKLILSMCLWMMRSIWTHWTDLGRFKLLTRALHFCETAQTYNTML